MVLLLVCLCMCLSIAAVVLGIYLVNDSVLGTSSSGNDDQGGGGGGGGGGGNNGSGNLPVNDLKKSGGGVWNVQGRIDWKKGSVTTFQGEPVVRIVYGKGSGTSHHSGVGGIGFDCVPKGLPSSSAMMSFQVYFEPGWDFSGGGKLLGFRIGVGNSSGGEHSSTGASCRISFKKEGGAWMYVYPPENLAQVDPKLGRDYGTGIGLYQENFPPGTFKIGKWNDVKLAVRVNSFDGGGKPNADGMAYLEINGRSATLKQMRWSRSPDLIISAFNFTSFFGGSDPAKVDCASLFRNFNLSRWD